MTPTVHLVSVLSISSQWWTRFLTVWAHLGGAVLADPMVENHLVRLLHSLDPRRTHSELTRSVPIRCAPIRCAPTHYVLTRGVSSGVRGTQRETSGAVTWTLFTAVEGWFLTPFTGHRS